MKRKTINAVISKKFDEWVATITDETVKKLVEKNTICTGGCIASMLLNETPNDFDFYFRDFDTALAVAHYYVGKFKENSGNAKKASEREGISVRVSDTQTSDDPPVIERRISIVVKSSGAASESQDNSYMYFEQLPADDRLRMIEFLNGLSAAKDAEEAASDEEKEKPKYRPVFLSRNAISLSQQVQLVIRFYGNPDQIHENYDYDHVRNYWTSWERRVTLRPEALEALLTKELRYNGSKYPLCSLFRLKKFVERGWRVNAGTILKIAWNLQEFNLKDIAVLEEQLTGVDTAYFLEIIGLLRLKSPESVDGSYLMNLIDRMF